VALKSIPVPDVEKTRFPLAMYRELPDDTCVSPFAVIRNASVSLVPNTNTLSEGELIDVPVPRLTTPYVPIPLKSASVPLSCAVFSVTSAVIVLIPLITAPLGNVGAPVDALFTIVLALILDI